MAGHDRANAGRGRSGVELALPLPDGAASGYLALPASGRGRGVLVFHEAWGLLDPIRDACDRLARSGFAALAPDLYAGRSSDEIEGAVALMNQLTPERAGMLVDASVEALLRSEACEGARIGALGYCMGGQLALFAACRSPRIAAAVDFYGSFPGLPLELAKCRAAVLAIFAERDAYVPAAQVESLRAELARAGVRASVRVQPGVAHAFMNESRPDVFDAAAAAAGWSALLAFLRAELA